MSTPISGDLGNLPPLPKDEYDRAMYEFKKEDADLRAEFKQKITEPGKLLSAGTPAKGTAERKLAKKKYEADSAAYNAKRDAFIARRDLVIRRGFVVSQEGKHESSRF